MLGLILKNVPIVGSGYKFVKTTTKVYNSTTPMGAAMTGLKSIAIGCTPRVIKYPVLFSALVLCGCTAVTTGGNPLAVFATTNVAICLLLED